MAQSPELAERLGLDRPRVLYAQTDSIFVLLPEKSVLDASQVGGMLASIITEEISEPPVKLNYETCVSNFLLQAVNRYAAKGSDGSLLAKGVETDRRVIRGSELRIQRASGRASERRGVGDGEAWGGGWGETEWV